MTRSYSKKYFFLSVILHGILLLVFILGFDHASVLPVFENTNKNDVISAVVLGDSAKSKILPTEVSKPLEKAEVKSPDTPMSRPAPKEIDSIALKAAEKKKLALQKAQEAKRQRELFAKELLADIKKQADQKNAKQNKLKTAFAKKLQEQAEKSLRQQLLNEEIKLKGKESHQSQGEVNKYKALILQSISEHWIVPLQANRKLSCELLIRLSPTGLVLDVQVTKTSGDPSLDSSARAAVLKASPLPVPSAKDAFEPFRQFVLKVKPENVLGNDA